MAGDGGRVPDVSEQRAEGCRVNAFSSRACERGTKGCEVQHDDPASLLSKAPKEDGDA